MTDEKISLIRQTLKDLGEHDAFETFVYDDVTHDDIVHATDDDGTAEQFDLWCYFNIK